MPPTPRGVCLQHDPASVPAHHAALVQSAQRIDPCSVSRQIWALAMPLLAARTTRTVTVIVRGSNRTCSPEKTYEAQSDSPLPLVFIDGTQRSGPEENVLLTVHDEGQRVEIRARHIATRVIVRRAGRYLALSVQLPEELALSGSSGLQLCARGCPASERLDPDAARGQALPREVAMARCRRHMPSVNLSAPYLDWCVFDVMTTGDGAVAEEFVAAAHSAQEDVVRLDPGSLNGTSPGFEPNAAFSAFSAGKTLLSILTLLAALAATT
uniref:Repulsive guidance molecule C-terminal domain-containing protein n=1 Tax=Timema tahoe TaxID=61484 RepID=A0A7R9FJY2_9NEOP|nr:unnamed protein product [Timema tahoe]